MAKAKITIEIEIEEDGKVSAGNQPQLRVFRPGGRTLFKTLLELADAMENIGDREGAKGLREQAWRSCTREAKVNGFHIHV